MAMPISAIASTAEGFTREGAEPALITVARSPSRWRARPSAIWLRAELATQRNRMRVIVGSLPRLLDRLAVATHGGAGLVPALDGVHDLHRSEERRVGKECVSTCRSRWSP